jgi:hypothetical protein
MTFLNALQIEGLNTLLMDRSDMVSMMIGAREPDKPEGDAVVTFVLKDKPAQVYILYHNDYMPERYA